MTKRLLIDARQAEETRVVLLSGTRIEDFDYETENRKQLKGNVYLARVTRVEPSLQAAFVEYGGNRQGFLAFSEIHPDYYRIPIEDREALIEADSAEGDDDSDETGSDGAPETIGGEEADEEDIRPKRQVKRYKIQEVISRKQIMLVQVVKEERGNKGAALTTYLSLAGRYCVLMPNNNRGGGVSRKITNIADRKRLKTVVGGLDIQAGMAVIVRTAGAKRTKTEIARDFTYLSKLWDDIRARTLESQAPCLIHEEGDLIKRSIRDLYTSEVDEVLVEGEEAYKIARNQMKMLIPSHLKKVQKYEGTHPIFQHFNVENQMDTIHSPQVTLKSGGYLVINQTEALVAIDVNSGKSTRERNIEETALKTNLEAAEELGRQLRLRDLSGLIVVDFIDMEENRNQHAVERRMKDAMRNDRARIQIGSISHFGLLEMSRQRLRLSINESISNLCPHCEGTGRVRSIDTAALQLLRSIEEEAQKGKMDELHITAHRDVVLFILNHKRSAIAEIEARFGIMVILLSDDSLIAPEYKVDRVGWQGKAQTKQQSRQPQQPRHANNNVKPDTSDPDKDEAAETEANAAPHPENDETGSEDGGAKRRRRGRRGGRRRRRRNGEDGQTGDNQTGDNQTGDNQTGDNQTGENQAASAPNGEDQAAASSTDTATDGFAANEDDAPKAKTGRGRGRGRRVAKADPAAAGNVAKDNAPKDSATDDNKAPEAAAEPASDGSINTAAADGNGDAAAAPKKPARRRKKPANAVKANDAQKVDEVKAEDSKAEAPAKIEDSKAEADSSAEKPAKKPARARKPKAKADAGDKPEQDAAAAKPAAKKPAGKATKKAPAKVADANNAEASANNRAPADAPAAREAISSAPQDVVEIGSSEPKSRRSGWWSRS
ncbi:Rne/Rng family ribonuclease [Alphaproteobacteria bacterium]|nr:Rne/Rng family ribonuclease [Alphaproteobacteria bacterium]